MRVLVTRPLPDAEATAADLRRLGHEPVLAPMLETHFADWASIDRSAPPAALIATSPNGIRGLMRHPDFDRLRHLPLFVTGEASARLARSFGFLDVRSADGDAAAVVALVAAQSPPGDRLLYAAGHDRSGDPAAALREKGYAVDVAEIYRAAVVSSLPQHVAADLRAGAIDRILIFSARTGAALVEALSRSDLLPVSRPIPIHAISRQAAEPLAAAGFASIIVALRPDAAELLDTLERSR